MNIGRKAMNMVKGNKYGAKMPHVYYLCLVGVPKMLIFSDECVFYYSYSHIHYLLNEVQMVVSHIYYLLEPYYVTKEEINSKRTTEKEHQANCKS